MLQRLKRRPPRRAQNEKVLRGVRPNLGIQAAYRRRLHNLIDEMSRSVVFWLHASYSANRPEMAQDETPADALRRSIQQMSEQWLKRFDQASAELAKYFSYSVEDRSSATLRKILKDGGFSVEFHMTPAMRDVVDATVNANVGLIKSIPRQYLEQVEGIVMRGVQNGRDVGLVAKELESRLGVTRKRAAFIALDQNNKATAAMTRARHLEVGLDEAVWVHSGGGREPRPTHLKAGRDHVRYKIAEGWYDPAVNQNIQPGELINCRCVGRPVLKGFT